MRTRAHPRLPASRRLGNAAGLPSSSANLTLGVEGYYAFDNNLNDSSPNARHLTDLGATFSAPGKVGSHFLSGSGGNVSLSSAFTKLTVSVWVMRAVSGASVVRPVSVQAGATVMAQVSVSAGGAGSLSFTYNDFAVTLAGGTMPLGTWKHVLGTFDGSGGNLYVNGSLVASDATPWTTGTVDLFDFTTTVRVQADDAAIYSRVLSTTEIAALYNGGSGHNPYA